MVIFGHLRQKTGNFGTRDKNCFIFLEKNKKNVWTSDKSWEPGSFLMFSYIFQCFLTFSNVTYFHSHCHSLSLTHSLTISLSHSFNLSLNHSWHAEQLLFSSLCSKVTLTLSCSHSHTLSLTLTLSQSLIHSLSTCWTIFVSKVTVYSRKLQCFFWDLSLSLSLWVLSSLSWFPAKKRNVSKFWRGNWSIWPPAPRKAAKKI